MERIELKIESFLRTGQGDFESLALELFAYQFEKNGPYQAYCRSIGMTPENVKSWHAIPAVPIGSFKSSELTTFPVGRAAAIFESSGTTLKTPSRHFLKTLTYYETVLKSSFAKWVLADQAYMPFFILAPAPGEAPRSSLSWMLDVVKRKWGASGSQYLVKNGRLDELWLSTLLKKSQAEGKPAALLGTTIAFLAFFDHLTKTGQSFRLPAGSRIMDTGGMKTQRRDVRRPDFIRQLEKCLGIPDILCINEYGMCEMSSQFYGRGSTAYLQGPVWTKTLVVDPNNLLPVPTGTPGLLRHFDLANVDSVLAIQTEDIGIADHEGFVLQGRDPAAAEKGCSIAAESFAQ